MRRRWFYVLTIALLIVFASPGVMAGKKSHAGKKTTSARAKKEPRGKSSRGRVAKSGRNTKAVSSRDKKHLSRRERRELARSQQRGKVKYVSRGRNGRRYVRYQARTRNDAEVAAAPAPPRPASGISTERVTEIQQALIKSGYLQGEPTGQYDENTVQAMKLFQAANGLSKTGTPSAATLKKLGVSKRSNDGYAVPVKSVSESEKRRSPQSQ